MKASERIDNATLLKQDKRWKVSFVETKKSMNCNWSNIPEDWNGQEVKVKRSDGKITELKFGDKVVSQTASNYKKEDNSKKYSPKSNSPKYKSTSTLNKDARSPYNFIPLNDTVIEAHQNPVHGHATYDPERLSGYIDLSIEALTPLFIRGKDSRFLLLDNKPVIPGSSLRGMTRILMEIVGYGKFINFEDKQLYKRGTLVEMKEDDAPQAGFLIYENSGYSIRKATLTNSSHFHKEFSYRFFNNGCKFTSGKFGNKDPRSFEFILNRNGGDNIPVPSGVKKSFEDDKQRAGSAPDVFKCTRKGNVKGVPIAQNLGMPVFYTLKNGKVFSVSHAKYGRIPYPSMISDHIPEGLKSSKKVDFAEAIFGTTKYATRVYFEDALINQEENREMNKMQPKILSSPKPTSYQLYLEQSNRSKLMTWTDEDAKIRGYKMYWHRITPDNPNEPYTWTENQIKPSDSHPDPIKAVKLGTKFSGRIRFDNLTKEELGCLLTALQLPEGCCHKLGMAKPLGLGTVKIIPELKIIDRKKRYENLFDTNGQWFDGMTEDNDIKIYQDHFAKYIMKVLGKGDNKTISDLWNENRIQQLKAMLTWEKDRMKSQEWLEKTRYMEIERKDAIGKKISEYNNRPILPEPEKVIRS